jgi:TPR repeat protein
MNSGLEIPEGELPNLEKAALDGDGAAALRLAQYYGFANVNRSEELYWLTISAEDGNPVGQYSLGFELATRERSDRNLARAVFWLRKAKAAGVPIAPEFVKEFGDKLDEKAKK